MVWERFYVKYDATAIRQKTIEIKPYKYKGNISFIDTPGLNDVNSSNSEVTKKYFKKANIVLFFLNAAGTVFSEVEKESFENIRKLRNSILEILKKKCKDILFAKSIKENSSFANAWIIGAYV